MTASTGGLKSHPPEDQGWAAEIVGGRQPWAVLRGENKPFIVSDCSVAFAIRLNLFMASVC